MTGMPKHPLQVYHPRAPHRNAHSLPPVIPPGNDFFHVCICGVKLVPDPDCAREERLQHHFDAVIAMTLLSSITSCSCHAQAWQTCSMPIMTHRGEVTVQYPYMLKTLLSSDTRHLGTGLVAGVNVMLPSAQPAGGGPKEPLSLPAPYASAHSASAAASAAPRPVSGLTSIYYAEKGRMTGCVPLR